MKMTVKEALKRACSLNGSEYTKERYKKLLNFLEKLPQNPSDKRYKSDGFEFTIKDYSEGWYAIVSLSDKNGVINIETIDGDMMDANEKRVKSNQEAIKVMEEIKSIKYAYDIDKYWNMSDDHRYYRSMSEHDNKMKIKEMGLRSKLK